MSEVKGWILLFVAFILICVIGYCNQSNHKDCVERETVKCESEGYESCDSKARSTCDFEMK